MKEERSFSIMLLSPVLFNMVINYLDNDVEIGLSSFAVDELGEIMHMLDNWIKTPKRSKCNKDWWNEWWSIGDIFMFSQSWEWKDNRYSNEEGT